MILKFNSKFKCLNDISFHVLNCLITFMKSNKNILFYDLYWLYERILQNISLFMRKMFLKYFKQNWQSLYYFIYFFQTINSLRRENLGVRLVRFIKDLFQNSTYSFTALTLTPFYLREDLKKNKRQTKWHWSFLCETPYPKDIVT